MIYYIWLPTRRWEFDSPIPLKISSYLNQYQDSNYHQRKLVSWMVVQVVAPISPHKEQSYQIRYVKGFEVPKPYQNCPYAGIGIQGCLRNSYLQVRILLGVQLNKGDYPSGLRERIANPLCTGSNPVSPSRIVVEKDIYPYLQVRKKQTTMYKKRNLLKQAVF